MSSSGCGGLEILYFSCVVVKCFYLLSFISVVEIILSRL